MGSEIERCREECAVALRHGARRGDSGKTDGTLEELFGAAATDAGLRGDSSTASSRSAWNGRFRRLRRSEEHTSEHQSRFDLVCRLLLEKKKMAATICRGLVCCRA